MSECPCCGQTMPAKGLPDGLMLPEVKKKIFERVQKSGINGVSMPRLHAYLYQLDPNGGASINCVRVHISQMNKVLHKHKLHITGGLYQGRDYAVYRLQPFNADLSP